MMLSRLLQHAAASGVKVLAYDIDWQLKAQGDYAVWGKKLAVRYGQEVDAAIMDWDHLEEVLEFNATDPRTHWKSKQKAAKEGEASGLEKGAGHKKALVKRQRKAGANKAPAGAKPTKEDE
jgi:hypothetical protein